MAANEPQHGADGQPAREGRQQQEQVKASNLQQQQQRAAHATMEQIYHRQQYYFHQQAFAHPAAASSHFMPDHVYQQSLFERFLLPAAAAMAGAAAAAATASLAGQLGKRDAPASSPTSGGKKLKSNKQMAAAVSNRSLFSPPIDGTNSSAEMMITDKLDCNDGKSKPRRKMKRKRRHRCRKRKHRVDSRTETTSLQPSAVDDVGSRTIDGHGEPHSTGAGLESSCSGSSGSGEGVSTRATQIAIDAVDQKNQSGALVIKLNAAD